LSYLRQKGVKNNEIAIWLSKEKQNLELIEKNNNEVNFMLFKVAPATGWDCPRADVLVMFREIGTPSFHTQIIGRIKRMPEGHHYPKEELNKAYIYTNYNKNHIKDIKEVENGNKPPVHYSSLKESIIPITLETVFHHRTDFNTITPPHLWQKSFIKTLDNYFGTELLSFDLSKNINIVKDKINLDQESVNNKIVVNAEIESYDNFVQEIKDKSQNYDYHFSQLDIERLYNVLCFEELKKQQLDDAKYNPSRSWGQLKQVLNVWFSTRFGFERSLWYKIIVNELLNSNSELKKSIHKALIEFREVYHTTIIEKEEKDIFDIFIPEKEVNFTDDFEEIEVSKNVYEKFYIRKIYKGKENETKFIEFLESQDIDWWHKQGDSGRNAFAVEYYDTQEKKNRLFHLDFIVKKGDTVYLLDTKSGNTAKSQETADKNKALQQWIKSKKEVYEFNIIGGIVDYKHPSWRINTKENYVYENESDWDDFMI
jgi:type III restriction enzyme